MENVYNTRNVWRIGKCNAITLPKKWVVQHQVTTKDRIQAIGLPNGDLLLKRIKTSPPAVVSTQEVPTPSNAESNPHLTTV